MHPSWRSFARLDLTAIGSDRWELKSRSQLATVTRERSGEIPKDSVAVRGKSRAGPQSSSGGFSPRSSVRS